MKSKNSPSKRIKKSEIIPKYWSVERVMFSNFLHETPEYQESVKKGLPFFTQEELNEIEEKYRGGMTWNDIESVLAGKGMIFKKSTFRKHIQERTIPPSKGYRPTERGREAIYPSDIILHINFVQYFYKIADNELFSRILELFADQVTTAKSAIENNIENQNLFSAVCLYVKGVSWEGNDILETIQEVLQHDPEFQNKVVDGLDEMSTVFNEKFDEWVKVLENYEIPIMDFIKK